MCKLLIAQIFRIFCYLKQYNQKNTQFLAKVLPNEEKFCALLTASQYSEWIVGPLSSAMCHLFFFNLLAATSQFSVCIEQKMQLNGWDNGKDMHIAKCADTSFS